MTRFFHFNQAAFQTGWFLESLSTQVLVLFIIRPMGRPWSNRPSAALVITAVVVVLVGAALPYSSLAGLLGLVPMPAGYFFFVILLVPAYLTMVELLKARLLRRILRPEASTARSSRPTR